MKMYCALLSMTVISSHQMVGICVHCVDVDLYVAVVTLLSSECVTAATIAIVIGSKSLYCIYSGGRGGVFRLYLPQT